MLPHCVIIIIIPSWNFICLLIVTVHYAVFCLFVVFFFQIVLGYLLQCLSLCFCLTGPLGIVWM